MDSAEPLLPIYTRYGSSADPDNFVRVWGSSKFVLAIIVFHKGPYELPQVEIGPERSNCFSRGSVQEFLRKHIATRDFQRDGRFCAHSRPLWLHPYACNLKGLFTLFFKCVYFLVYSMAGIIPH